MTRFCRAASPRRRQRTFLAVQPFPDRVRRCSLLRISAVSVSCASPGRPPSLGSGSPPPPCGRRSVRRSSFRVRRRPIRRGPCRLGVSRSSYCRWTAGAVAPAEHRADDDALVAEIHQLHDDHHGTYGVRRTHAELRGFGQRSTARGSSG
ncbi:IS3 family transposase [Streptomyces sp. NPDC085944]|uniref:IS3 family transposase n=1 Tax=Streptomyces sp. NPDC085944 TaxID=3154962 RepID=UPI003446234A